MSDDSRFEAELRETLARRDPGVAPAQLGDAILERLHSDGLGGSRWAVARRLASVAGAVTAVVALVTIFAIGRPVGVAPGSSAGPAASAVTSVGPGMGLSDPVGWPLLQIVLVGLVIAGLARLALRTSRRLVGYAAVAAIFGIVWVGSMIGTSDALARGGGVFGVEPFLERPDGFSEGQFVDANGDVEFRILWTVTNTSRLSLDVLGLPPEGQGGLLEPYRSNWPRVVALGYLPDEACCLAENARPFTRLTLESGQSANLVFIGRAGACATTAQPYAAAAVLSSVRLVYEQLTIRHEAELPLDPPVEVLGRSGCGSEPPSSTEPGGG